MTSNNRPLPIRWPPCGARSGRHRVSRSPAKSRACKNSRGVCGTALRTPSATPHEQRKMDKVELRREDASANRWKLVCYPSNTGAHADRFVQWFNDAMRISETQGWGSEPDVPSFAGLFITTSEPRTV